MKPLFIQEIEANTGLECVLEHDMKWASEWSVISPTGVVLFSVGGTNDCIGMISQPNMYAIQGTTQQERSRRRKLTGGGY